MYFLLVWVFLLSCLFVFLFSVFLWSRYATQKKFCCLPSYSFITFYIYWNLSHHIFFFCFVRNEDLSSYSFPHFKMSVNRFEKNRSLNNREENQTEQICRCPRATEQQIIPNWFRSHIFVIQPRVNTLFAWSVNCYADVSIRNLIIAVFHKENASVLDR